jgi:hypothetical protein
LEFLVAERFFRTMTIEQKMIREIVTLAYPVIIGMISHTVLNLVDTAMVGRLGDVALGSVGIGSFFILVTVLVFGSLHVGMQARRKEARGVRAYPAQWLPPRAHRRHRRLGCGLRPLITDILAPIR